MCGMFNLNEWDEEANYLVLDDCSFIRLGEKRKSLWGAQEHIVLDDKYHRKRTVKWGKPLIWLCQREQDFRWVMDQRGNTYLNNDELEWYVNNTVIVELERPLFRQ